MNYIVGLARNARLEAIVQYAEAMLADQYERTGIKQRLIDEFVYAAVSRIKEAQLELFGTRAVCHRFPADQLRPKNV